MGNSCTSVYSSTITLNHTYIYKNNITTSGCRVARTLKAVELYPSYKIYQDRKKYKFYASEKIAYKTRFIIYKTVKLNTDIRFPLGEKISKDCTYERMIVDSHNDSFLILTKEYECVYYANSTSVHISTDISTSEVVPYVFKEVVEHRKKMENVQISYQTME